MLITDMKPISGKGTDNINISTAWVIDNYRCEDGNIRSSNCFYVALACPTYVY